MGLIHCGFGVFLFLTHNLQAWFNLLYILLMFFQDILVLYPCCFCKLLGLCFMHRFVGFMVCTMFLSSLLCIVYSVLLTKCHAFSFLVLSLLCPCRIVPRCIYLMYYALVECWACKWFALSLLACMSKCSF